MPKRKQILRQMFDVRPTRRDGSLDMEKIRNFRRTVVIPGKTKIEREIRSPQKMVDVKTSSDIFKTRHGTAEKIPEKKESENIETRRANIIQLGQVAFDDRLSISRVPEPPTIFKDAPPVKKETGAEIKESAKKVRHPLKTRKRKKERKKLLALFHPLAASAMPRPKFRYAASFAGGLIIFSFLLPAAAFIKKNMDLKISVIENSQEALGQFAQAKNNLTNGKFDEAAVNFEESYEILHEAKREIAKIGGGFSDILNFVPGMSKVASANYVVSAGESLALAGKNIAESGETLGRLENPLEENSEKGPALTDVFLNLRRGVESASAELLKAEDNINKVNPDDLPEEARTKIMELKEKLPAVNASLKNFLDYSEIFLDVLGYNGQRKFLFLFQNNQEMRATGGFIGSYGILDIGSGRVKKLLVDDIYNPDGQLKARVIPPEPIQKMSAVWTMHDANWFPDFPASAEKVSWFYEKTGGPTVDGVIAVTPNLIQSLLEITGPIEMPEYDTTVDAQNFISETQQEVEFEYDKEENRPKKFIADLMPKIFDKVFNTRHISQMVKVLAALNQSLSEKQLLLYSKNYNIQKLISSEGWSGEILNTQKDYLSVVNTNINGYKTDGVIEETIEHQSEIQNDGSVVDTVTVTRHHFGGNEEYDWWNKVNGDWMRVYVPEGSRLLEASGQTREFVSPPLDYATLDFKKDPQLESIEDSTQIDEESGTRMYSENHKTVFANWVYVSPGETVKLKYKYRLPFRLNFDTLHHPADSFSVLYQKQSGSRGSKLVSEIKLPDDMKTIWRWPENAKLDGSIIKFSADLATDKFVGLAIEKL